MRPVLKGTRWLLHKRPENLTEKQEPRLAELLRYNPAGGPQLPPAGRLPVLLDLRVPHLGRAIPGPLVQPRTLRPQIEPMKTVARMLRSHRALLLDWFRAKGTMSSGTVEGFNNKAKLTTRKAYRVRTFQAIEIALYHTLGPDPSPKLPTNSAHEASFSVGSELARSTALRMCEDRASGLALARGHEIQMFAR